MNLSIKMRLSTGHIIEVDIIKDGFTKSGFRVRVVQILRTGKYISVMFVMKIPLKVNLEIT